MDAMPAQHLALLKVSLLVLLLLLVLLVATAISEIFTRPQHLGFEAILTHP